MKTLAKSRSWGDNQKGTHKTSDDSNGDDDITHFSISIITDDFIGTFVNSNDFDMERSFSMNLFWKPMKR